VAASFDVIVVGGGPVGAACARELALTGRRVLVVEPGGESGQAWRAAAGMLAPQIEAHADDAMLELGLAARELYTTLSQSLRETTGIDIGLWREGIACVAASESEATELRSQCAWQRQHGHLSDWLDADEVSTRWPWLGPTCGALWAAREGALEPERLVAALLADGQRVGAATAQDAVLAIDQRGDRVVGVTTRSGARYSAGDVILAAGAWSAGVQGLPRPVAVAPVRGQMAALPWPEGARRAIVYGRGGYLLARGDEAIAGSTMEYVGFRSETTAAGLARIFDTATALCPALSSAAVKRTWAGLRPMTPDGLPIIGAEPRLPGLWYATGHGRNGILLAAITGVILRQLVAGEPTEERVDGLAPTRFWSW
jgi:glycine oxidase